MSQHRAINLLVLLFPGFNTLDANGPIEVFSKASVPPGSETGITYKLTVAAKDDYIQAGEGVTIRRDLSLQCALENISDYHILIQPGAGLEEIDCYINKDPAFQDHKTIIQKFLQLGQSSENPRVLLTICTGALLVGYVGGFDGLEATTHFEGQNCLRSYCNAYAEQYGGKGATIIPELKCSDDTEPDIIFCAYKSAMEKLVRWVDAGCNATGVRVISSGGISCGLDASLFVDHGVCMEMGLV
ncbi:hypothetical protein EYZ11_013200 [Aspergillus tanneri]|uniref:DJ-1/PfpI domain-containing protein n=1 Tax=Aspergillus tanneri TaxID=1220188 RepID=A0A4S3IYC1_9EURO|nr:hypothetical protein EYZ11_013200 [Aspergillus tanneri]